MTIKDDILEASGNPEALSLALALKLQPLTDRVSVLEGDGIVISTAAAAVADIADPATATAEDCANKINELLASMRAAGFLAT